MLTHKHCEQTSKCWENVKPPTFLGMGSASSTGPVLWRQPFCIGQLDMLEDVFVEHFRQQFRTQNGQPSTDKLQSHDGRLSKTVFTTDAREHLPRLVCLNQLIFDLKRAVRDQQLKSLKHIDALFFLRALSLDEDRSGNRHVGPRSRTTCYDARSLRILANCRHFDNSYEILAHRDHQLHSAGPHRPRNGIPLIFIPPCPKMLERNFWDERWLFPGPIPHDAPADRDHY